MVVQNVWFFISLESIEQISVFQFMVFSNMVKESSIHHLLTNSKSFLSVIQFEFSNQIINEFRSNEAFFEGSQVVFSVFNIDFISKFFSQIPIGVSLSFDFHVFKIVWDVQDFVVEWNDGGIVGDGKSWV